MALTISALIAIVAAVAIYGASLLFVNGIEWVGRRLKLGETVTGAILAALGTALPETMITLVAVAFGGGQAGDIGIGTALGGPLALSIFGYGVYGLATRLAGRERADARPDEESRRLTRDQLWFMAMFAVQLALGLIAFGWKSWTALIFLAAYGAYVWRTSRTGSKIAVEKPRPLIIAPRSPTPPLAMMVLQTFGALAVVAVASRFFVIQLEHFGAALGLTQQTTGLLLSPIATELPEILNTVIWIRRGKSAMALANISGAMMVQTALPTALGLAFTSWRLNPTLIFAGVATLLATFFVLLLARHSTKKRRVAEPA